MKPDDPTHPPSVREIFLAALEQPSPAERVAFVAVACRGNAALGARVEALLRSHREDSFLEWPALKPTETGSATAPLPALEGAGTVIGRYKLLEKLGEGGCGVVYLAEQEEPVRRHVALKLIKLGMDTRGFIARFEAERQALAMMDHSHIARVFDAGATDAGRPFFVMELVRGVKITEFCDQKNLSTDARLELFAQVCHAVQHAHQKGIIHRDLKPSNVLVSLHDGVPVPKVIDFGIAKATAGERLTDKTLFTAFDQFVGTPAYMSPEQAESSGLDIDTRSDIYSLGVLLYELVTGTTPFEANALWNSGLEAMRRTIRETEPPKPSTRLTQELVAARLKKGRAPAPCALDPRPHGSALGEGLRPGAGSPVRPKVAGGAPAHAPEAGALVTSRLLQLKELIHRVRGDLDWIAMKALEKDRSRRYETAAGLAEDIQRHLQSEPVLARPPSRFYRLQKLARRNRVAFAAGSAVASALVIGLCVASWALVRERAALTGANLSEKRATGEAAKSAQVSRFLQEMLMSAQPSIAQGRDTGLLQEIVGRAAARVDRELGDQPEIAAELHATLGGVYHSLGNYTNAETLFRAALSTRRRLFGSQDLRVAEALDLLGGALCFQRQGSTAEPLFREALDIRTRLLGPTNVAIAESLNDLAQALKDQNKLAEAELIQREALALQQRLFGPEHIKVATFVHNLASLLAGQNKDAEAEPLLRQVLPLFKKTHGTRHPDVVSAQHTLATVLSKQGKDVEAEALFRETLRLKEALYGPDHPEIKVTRRNLASMLRRLGRTAEVEELLRAVLESARRGGVFSSQDLEGCLYDLASLGLDRAWAEHEAAGELRNSVSAAQRAREAEGFLRDFLASRAQSAGTNDPASTRGRSLLVGALVLIAAADGSLMPTPRDAILAEAESLLLDVLPQPQGSAFKRKALHHLVRLYEASGKPEKAAQWKATLAEADQAK